MRHSPERLAAEAEEFSPFDPINPDHYKVGGLEVIDILKAKLPTADFMGFLQGNTLKYILRFQWKSGLEDLKKARWYLDYLISFLESK